jgi:1-acyl-sn-glycerol-3-phosphate acyltransferase
MSQSRLLSQRKFAPIFWTQFLGAFNDNLMKNALVIMIAYKGIVLWGLGKNEVVAAAGGLFILPFFLFSALAGQMADKWDKASITRALKLLEIVIMALAVLGFLTDQFGFLMLVLFLMGAQSAFFGPIKYSILPQHLRPDELVGGNALVEAGTFVAILLGTIAGGELIRKGNGPLVVSAMLMLFAVGGYIASRYIPRAPAASPNVKLDWNPVTPTFKMMGFAKEVRSVWLSILGISWFWLFGAVMLSLFPIIATDIVNADERLVTMFLTTFSVGIALGSLLCEKLSRQRLELGLVPLGSIGITLFAGLLAFLLRGLSPGPEAVGSFSFLLTVRGALILIDLFLLSVFSGFLIVPLYTMMQERSAVESRSRVIAANNVINALFMVIAALLLGMALRFGMSIPAIILALAVFNGIVAVYIYTLLPEFLLRFMIWVVTRIMYRVDVHGANHVPKEGPAILVCNHVSFVDWMIIGGTVKRPVRFVMDHSFFRGWLVKRILTRGKVIPIASAKEDPARLEEAFRRISEELNDGELVCIFPEGRITKDGKLNEFRPGVLKMLGTNPVPVIPMGLSGLWGSFFSRQGGHAMQKLPRRFRAPLTLKIGAPLSPEGLKLEEIQAAVVALRGPKEP